MIPSTTNQYLVTEDWKKIFQSYPNAEFQSYDFETLRRVMISYLQENYPEDFNDYIDSSEYLALVDLIAFLGQNLSFRIDLNARENFLETAQRRDSILNLASLIGYNPSRNTPASGFLKIVSVSTTDVVLDSNGTNLANQSITWNDPTNINWYEQFLTILNSAMPSGVIFGRPYDTATINGIDTQQYKINSSNSGVPVYSFSSNINGTSMGFEIVGSLFSGKSYIYEDPPAPGNQFSFIYTNDNQGNGSANTGFFAHFKQGALNASSFSISQPVPNELISIQADGTNHNDVWLWQQDLNGAYTRLWTKVPSIIGNNVIYNSVNKQIKTIYSVLTAANDQFNLSFTDGNFGQLPQGNFTTFYRQSNGLSYVIRPDQITNISVTIPYTNKNGQSNNLRLVMSLQETVSNSQATESNASIQLKAPQTYYSQNRMVTAEDYNILPLTAGSDILKIHSINRTSSGISRYFELADVSGEYSNTNIFATDGMIYKKYQTDVINFSFVNQNDITGFIDNKIYSILLDPAIFNFYLDKYFRVDASGINAVWQQVTQSTNQSTGYFSIFDYPVAVGSYSENYLRYITPGSLIKFIPPKNQYFLPNNALTTIEDSTTKKYIWAQISLVVGDGSNSGLGILSNSTGPIVLSTQIPAGSIPVEIIPAFQDSLPVSLQNEMVSIISENRNLGISFDAITRSWNLITDSNLDLMSPFSLDFQGDTSNINKDNSWLISFSWNGIGYEVSYRFLNYIFESEKQTAFFVDQTNKNYDFVKDTVIKDQIVVLGINDTVATTEIVTNTSTFVPILTTSTLAATFPTYISGSPNYGTLNIASDWLGINKIAGNTYYAITPSITGGVAIVTNVSTNTGINSSLLTLSTTLASEVTAGAPVSLFPIQVQTSNVTLFTPNQSSQSISLGKDYRWQVDSAIVEPDGYVNPNSVIVSFFDKTETGQIEDPDTFNNIVLPDDVNSQTGFLHNFVYFEYLADGTSYQLADSGLFSAYPTPADVASPNTSTLYYFYDPAYNIVQTWSDITQSYTLNNNYFAYTGRRGLKFQYLHNSGRDRRIDPSKTNLIDIYLLTNSYDVAYREWLASGTGSEPLPPTSIELANQYNDLLDPIKSISDELVFQPAVYKVLFGSKADPALQGTFKAVQNLGISNSTNNLKTRILAAIENFFALTNWNFGDTFNFSELSTYVMNIMTPDITNFIIVPNNSNNKFGSLYEIHSQSNEILINGATVADIEIISAITASQLLSSGNVVTNTTGN